MDFMVDEVRCKFALLFKSESFIQINVYNP